MSVCSFCLRPAADVGTLVAGPGVYICDGCVSLCGTVIATKPATAEHVLPWQRETDLEQVLDRLPAIAAAGSQVEQNLTEWVRRARTLGATWARVGGSLGMTRQSAWERFSGEE